MPVSAGSSGTRRLWAACSAVAALVLLSTAPAFGATPVWNVARIGAPASASGITIAVVDTGVDAGHIAFGGRVLPQIDFVNDGQRNDPNGHGTHVAGSAAGGAVDCGGGAVDIGVASTANILPLRVLDADGTGSMSNVAAAIQRAADEGVAVINLSLGSDVTIVTGSGATLRGAIEYAWSKGSIPVLAAGNSGLVGSLFGSGYDDQLPAVVVTATNSADRKPGYATAVGSARWAVAAPGGDNSRRAGEDILSAWPGGQCALLAGTSMAAPHVSGALAALRARGLSAPQAVDRLLATADPISPRSTYGSGLVNLGRALEGLGGTATATPKPKPTVPPTTATTVAPAAAPTPTTDGGATPDAGAPPATDPASSPDSTTAVVVGDATPPSTGDAGGAPTEPASDGAPADAASSTTSPGSGPADADDGDGSGEAASGLSTVVDEATRGTVGAPLAVGAGLAVGGLWFATGRAAIRLRR